MIYIYVMAPSHFWFKNSMIDILDNFSVRHKIEGYATSFVIDYKYQFQYVPNGRYLRGRKGFYLTIFGLYKMQEEMQMILKSRIASRDLVEWDWKILEREPWKKENI